MEDVVGKKPVIQVKFDFTLIRLEEIHPNELKEISIKWSRGKKKGNKGQVILEEIKNSMSDINKKFSVKASIQQLGKNKYEPKLLVLTLREKKRKLSKTNINLGEIMENYSTEKKTLSLTKNNNFILHYIVLVEILRIGKYWVKVTDYPRENTLKYVGNFYELDLNASLKNEDLSLTESMTRSEESVAGLNNSTGDSTKVHNGNRKPKRPSSFFLSNSIESVEKRDGNKYNNSPDDADIASVNSGMEEKSATVSDRTGTGDGSSTVIRWSDSMKASETSQSKQFANDKNEKNRKERFKDLKKHFEAYLPKVPAIKESNDVVGIDKGMEIDMRGHKENKESLEPKKNEVSVQKHHDVLASPVVVEKKVENDEKKPSLVEKQVGDFSPKLFGTSDLKQTIERIEARMKEIRSRLLMVEEGKSAIIEKRNELNIKIKQNSIRFKEVEKKINDTEMAQGLLKLEKSELMNTSSWISENKSGLAILYNRIKRLISYVEELKKGREFEKVREDIIRLSKEVPRLKPKVQKELLRVEQLVEQLEMEFAGILLELSKLSKAKDASQTISEDREKKLEEALNMIGILEGNKLALQSQIQQLKDESVELTRKVKEYEQERVVRNFSEVNNKEQIKSNNEGNLDLVSKKSGNKKRSKGNKEEGVSKKEADIILGLEASLAISAISLEKKKKKVLELKSLLKTEEAANQKIIEKIKLEKSAIEEELNQVKRFVAEIEEKNRQNIENLTQKVSHLKLFISALDINVESIFEELNTNIIKDKFDLLARELEEMRKLEQTVYRIKGISRADELTPPLFDLLEWLKLEGYFDQSPSKFLNHVTQSFEHQALVSPSMKYLLAWIGQMGLIRNYVMEYYGSSVENSEMTEPTDNPAANFFVFGIEDATLNVYNELLDVVYSKIETVCVLAFVKKNEAKMLKLRNLFIKIIGWGNELGLHMDVMKQIMKQAFYFIDCLLFNEFVEINSSYCSSTCAIETKLKIYEFVEFVNGIIPEINLDIKHFTNTIEALTLLILNKSYFTEKDLELFPHLNTKQILSLIENFSAIDEHMDIESNKSFYNLLKQKSSSKIEPLKLEIKKI